MADKDRYKTLPNGAVYDTKIKKIVKTAPIPQEPPKSPDTEPKAEPTINVSSEEINSLKSEKPQKKKPSKKSGDTAAPGVAHTRIGREILEYFETHKADKTNVEWLKERAFWYLDRCVEEGVTPIPKGIILALGFSLAEENIVLSGNSGLPVDCREFMGQLKQLLEASMEGALVDEKSGQVGRIFDLKNRYGWSDQGSYQATEGARLGEIKSPEDLRKAIAKMPGLDLIDEPKPIDVEFEVVE